jgi:Family of unknown function (DUF6467)
MCRIGGSNRSCYASNDGCAVEIPPFLHLGSNSCKGGHRVMGSLTGVVASQKVTEARKGSLSMVGNHAQSVLV